MATDKVRFVGEEIAAVAATDPYIAEEALRLIKVDYEPLSNVGGSALFQSFHPGKDPEGIGED